MMTSRSPCLSASPRRISKFTAAALFALTTATCRQMCLSFVVALCAGGMAAAQTNAKVTVNLAKELNILTSTSVGVPAIMSDGNTFNLATASYLKVAGISTVRFPGNHTAADLYHWSTNTASKYKGFDPIYLAPGSNFGTIATVADKMGTAFVVVNYGSNEQSTGGGEPAEAAAWVAYANGDPSDSKAIGKDSTGHDWQTVGYWASIRAQAPLAADDGMNFLRIGHTSPIKIKLWQVGDEVYRNGYYGGDHTGEPDLHGPAPNAVKDFAKLRKDANLSPAFYGAKLTEFAAAMKAVDPTIQIGAALATPPDMMSWASDWNTSVLKKACKDLDFVSLEWTTGGTLPPDYKTLNEEDLLNSARGQLNGILSGVLYDYKTSCPAGHIPRIAFAPAAAISWAKVERPISIGLWAADTYALLVESGSVNVSWSDMYSDAMMSNDRKKFGAVYSSLQMFHIIAHAPGDILVDAASNTPKLAVHATKRRDGFTAIMLINKDPQNAITAKVSIAGGPVGAKGKRFDYGITQQKAGLPTVPSEIKDLGAEFTVTVPPYSITDVLIEN
ncbi:MAG: hypothetical protein M3O31_10590 [Acidobacteriota bacterium]|nr:hypothetical protein [Acidobacteriota bacterium]